MNPHQFLYIGAEFIVGVIHMKDGSAMAQAPTVCLRDKARNQYYVADVVESSGINYFAKFTAVVTEEIEPATLNLEIYEDSSMEVMLRYWQDFTTAILVSASPGQREEPTPNS